ncbi:hypothetical protein PsorP6_003194 [Peronosclerospora sorghi]|uniref:Uncharacterized protein n=1 Tax=Peronosclerospora sorghi TaxID=230839 RepID=A0ACC0VNT0_9STRA|nr:hypothetical protein PsorP6_003194 [Peronosclerospora sorghi]
MASTVQRNQFEILNNNDVSQMAQVSTRILERSTTSCPSIQCVAWSLILYTHVVGLWFQGLAHLQSKVRSCPMGPPRRGAVQEASRPGLDEHQVHSWMCILHSTLAIHPKACFLMYSRSNKRSLGSTLASAQAVRDSQWMVSPIALWFPEATKDAIHPLSSSNSLLFERLAGGVMWEEPVKKGEDEACVYHRDVSCDEMTRNGALHRQRSLRTLTDDATRCLQFVCHVHSVFDRDIRSIVRLKQRVRAHPPPTRHEPRTKSCVEWQGDAASLPRAQPVDPCGTRAWEARHRASDASHVARSRPRWIYPGQAGYKSKSEANAMFVPPPTPQLASPLGSSGNGRWGRHHCSSCVLDPRTNELARSKSTLMRYLDWPLSFK